MTTVTQPELYFEYLQEQIGLLIKNHGVPVEIGESDIPIQLHFAFPGGKYVEGVSPDSLGDSLTDQLAVPRLEVTDYANVNGTWQQRRDDQRTLPRITPHRVTTLLNPC